VAGLAAFHQARQAREPRVVSAARERVLLAGNSTEIETLDPHLAKGVPEHKIISAIFEGLVAPASDDPDADAPGAASEWTHEGFTRWTFKLWPNGRWSDGTPLTAADFVYAYQRILSPDIAADYATMLYSMKNAEAYHKGELKDFSQVGVQAVGDYELRLTLTGPTPYLLGMLKHYTWFPVPRHVVERHGRMTDRLNPWTKPQNLVSNGPFKLKEWRFTHYLAVDRNPHYWDAVNVRLNGIRFYPIDADTTEERAFRDGRLHLTDLVPIARVPFYRKQEAGPFRADLTLGTQFLRLNTQRKVLGDVRVRRALALAVDREAIVSKVLRAGQVAAHGMTPPKCTAGYETPKMMRLDVPEAKRLLADAGYPDGKDFPRLEVLITQTSAGRTVAEALQEMWKNHLGIKISVLNQEWQVYLDAQRKKNYDIALAGWVGDYPDPTTFLNMFRTGDGNNETGYASAEYDRLVNGAASEADAAARLRMLNQAETLLLQDMPVVPIYWRVHYYLMRPEVKNFRASVLEHRAYKAIDVGL
jgi:oligopeptide transport system substrate-binding protein